MDLLPTTLGTRPRLALELRPEGVVAARSEDANAMVSAVAFSALPPGAILPGLRHGNLADRSTVVAAVRKALEAVALKERQTSLVLPDAAVRVLLLDFDTLPPKPAEALPVVKFRLKKLLPFDADNAVVSYQIMSSTRNLVRVVAVAIPCEVLSEYESVVREAGFEPGAVLPSTLAALSCLDEEDDSTLVVNAGESSVTTAIVQSGVLLLHRMVDLQAEGVEITPVAEVAPLPVIPAELLASASSLPLVDLDDSHAEWTMQQPVSGYGVLDDHHIDAGMEAHADTYPDARASLRARSLAEEIEREFEAGAHAAGFNAAELDDPRIPRAQMLPPLPDPVSLRVAAAAREVSQAVSVATAYFEDTLQRVPGHLLSTGSLGAAELSSMLLEAGFSEQEVSVRPMVDDSILTGGASTSRAPIGWLAGVRGALKS